MKTLKIYMFIFITNIVIQLFIQQIGEERLTSLLQGNHYLQMFYASLFGFIPNCVSSVVLTQLYTSHMLQFSSLFAGLTTNAGLGLLVLLKGNISFKTIVKIIIILLISAMIGGLFFSNLVI